MNETLPKPTLPPKQGYRAVTVGYLIGGSAVPVGLPAYVAAAPGSAPEATDKRHFCRVRFRGNHVAEGEPVFVSWRDAGLPGEHYNGTLGVTYLAGQICDLPSYEAAALEWAGAADILLDFAKGN